VSAQYRAGIQGIILDPQGGAVAGAKVTVTAKDTGAKLERLNRQADANSKASY
jgi:hypothetical protein